jgi:hypothetical protein
MIMIVRAIPESLITSIDCDDPALCLLVAQHMHRLHLLKISPFCVRQLNAREN